MTKTIITAILFLRFCLMVKAQYQVDNKGDSYYTKPVFACDYHDPGILRDGEDHYLAHSSFEYYPGSLIWHSAGLINRKPVTNELQKYAAPSGRPRED